jgi:hypothetical protein
MRCIIWWACTDYSTAFDILPSRFPFFLFPYVCNTALRMRVFAWTDYKAKKRSRLGLFYTISHVARYLIN